MLAPGVHAEGDAKRGLYIAQVAGCLGCHTEDKPSAPPFAGARALKTPFGTFYGPNITPDPQAGIGRWTEGDFRRAMRHGERPDGGNYFPAFPYTSFTRMTDEDVRDLWAYLRSVPPNGRSNQPHDLGVPYGWRFLVSIWKSLFFTPGPLPSDPKLTPALERGRYLVVALGHCGECHTPRNALGAMKKDRFLAGGLGPDGKRVPNLTQLQKWSDSELRDFLTTGMTADGDVPAEAMAEVIRNSTSKLRPDDLNAIIAYLKALPPLPDDAKK
jgi:mono/diheme cytochrome c family protein